MASVMQIKEANVLSHAIFAKNCHRISHRQQQAEFKPCSVLCQIQWKEITALQVIRVDDSMLPIENSKCAQTINRAAWGPAWQSSLDHVCYWFGAVLLNPYSAHKGRNKQTRAGQRRQTRFTCSEVVSCWKSHRFQFPIRDKFYPKVSSTASDIGRAVLTTVASKHGTEAKWSIPNFDVVKFTFPRGLNWIILLKV